MRFAVLDARVRAMVRDVAATEPDPLNPYRGLYVTDWQARRLAEEAPVPDVDERAARVTEQLGLDELDAAVLALCAAPELSPHYGRLFGFLHDDVSRRLASPMLVARLLRGPLHDAEAVLARFAAGAPLRRAHAVRLLEQPADGPHPERGVKVADRLVSALLGVRMDAPEWEARASRVGLEPLGRREHAVEELRRALALDAGSPALVAGMDAGLVAASAAESPLLVLPLADAADQATRHEAALAAALEGRTLCVGGLEDCDSEQLERELPPLLLLDDAPALFLIATPRAAALERWFPVRVEVPPADADERAAAWRRYSGREDVDEVARAFGLSIAQIEQAARTVQPGEELGAAARRVSALRLGDLARRMDAPYGWGDLVLPERQRRLLQSVSGYLRHRELVLREWGYARTVAPTQGLKVLFAGESGTGKTMAAQVVARDLGLEIFQIDLALIVSKYIGETEKNLRRVFTAAERSSAVLFFDEADALFGRRSEVRDSHDRYANVEVAYLLQQMEAHPGAVILATNLRQNIDQAFLRRLDFVIEFALPEDEDRQQIWHRVMPSGAPLADDVDVEFLAARFPLSGGSIRNASLAAAFMAADDGGPITMEHLVRAVALEYDKLGRLTLEAEFERFHPLVRR